MRARSVAESGQPLLKPIQVLDNGHYRVAVVLF